jgi:hypothetical protein
MQTLTFDPHRWWMARVVSRNPLIRRTDRVEVMAIIVAIVLSLAAIPVAAAVGTTVFESQHRLYVQQAQTRHRVVATVTEDSGGAGTVDVMASWITERGGRAGAVAWTAPVKRGDRIPVWVDTGGNAVDPPALSADAGFDAAAAGAIVVSVIVAMAGSLAAATRCWLDRIRDGQWESELRTVVGDDGGRTNGTGPGRPR